MELMVYLLNAFGYTPLMAHDGEEGVATARRELPDLIICDVHLPKLDGYGVVAQLKQDPAVAVQLGQVHIADDQVKLDGYGVVAQLKQDPALRPIPALAVTALAMVGDRERLLAAGFDGYIGKPIEPDTFVTQIESFLPGETSSPAKNDVATILIVDDHVLNREFLMTLLGYGGHRLLEASNGAEGLKMVSAERPDLVISDILMPNMDGYEFVTRMHSNPDTAHVPIIFYTATYREREAMAVAEACGVRWVLPKPSDPDVILRTVREAQERAVSRMESEFKTQVLEWKNTLLRGEDARKRELHWGAFQASEKRVAEAARALEPQLSDPQEKAALQKFTEAHTQMAQGYRKGFEVFQSLGFVPSAGDADVADIDQGPAKLLTALSEQVASSSAAIAQEAAQDARRALVSSLVALALVTGLGVVAGLVLTRSVVRPLREAVAVAHKVAAGDLTSTIALERQAEIDRNEAARVEKELR
eukprot:gene39028-48202_t